MMETLLWQSKREIKCLGHIQRKQQENLWKLKASNKLMTKFTEVPDTTQNNLNLAVSV
jgi:hypothetical protein